MVASNHKVYLGLEGLIVLAHPIGGDVLAADYLVQQVTGPFTPSGQFAHRCQPRAVQGGNPLEMLIGVGGQPRPGDARVIISEQCGQRFQEC